MPQYMVKVVYEGDQFMLVSADSPEEAEEIALDTCELSYALSAYVQYVADSDD